MVKWHHWKTHSKEKGENTMKKILAIVLCVMLLPLIALAEEATETIWVPVDFGDFTMKMQATDGLQMGEKAEGGLLFIAYPNYDPAALPHDNITAAWTAEKLTFTDETTQEEVDQFAQDVLDGIVVDMDAQGVAVTDPLMVSAEFADGSLCVLYSMTCDYTALNIDLVTGLYQMQLYVPVADGTYVFGLTSTTLEGVQYQLDNYFATIEMKEVAE